MAHKDKMSTRSSYEENKIIALAETRLIKEIKDCEIMVLGYDI